MTKLPPSISCHTAVGQKWGEEDELHETYLDICKFMILTKISDGHSQRPVFRDEDDEVFQLCMQQVRDDALKAALESAMDKYYVARGVADKSGSDIGNYDDDNIGIYRLSSYADIKYGIHLKKTDESGIYYFFVQDDGKISSSYSRSDSMFSNERVLI